MRPPRNPTSSMHVFSNAWRRLELFLAVALIGLSAILAARTALVMATTSLNIDEFGTVGTFSSHGPHRVVTDYRAPKNHIFFNLLNSVLPGRESLDPARVRVLSILATLLTGALIVAYAAWRARLMEGAIVVGLWSLAPEMLQRSMEARGYGFLGLFGVIASFAVIEYLRTKQRAWLWALACACTLGVYTMPGFLFFAAPLMLLLWLTDRTRATFLAGAATVVAILVLYAPILGQVLHEFSQFHQDKAEADFKTTHGLVRAVKLYLYSCDDWQAWALLAALALAPFAPLRMPDRQEGAALRVIAATCLVYFACLLVLKTPPLRTATFCMLPLAIAGTWALGSRFRSPLRPAIFGCVAIVLLFKLAGGIRSFQFTPTEDWLLAGRAIDTAFPGRVRVDFKHYAKYLGQTLADSASRSADYDPAAFADGSLVFAEAVSRWGDARTPRFATPPGLKRVAQWTIPGTIRDMVLTFRLPETSGLRDAPPNLTDGRSDTGARLSSGDISLHGEAPPNARSLVILLNRAPARDELQVDAPGRAIFLAGNAVVIPLHPGERADVRLRAAKGSTLQATEAWIAR